MNKIILCLLIICSITFGQIITGSGTAESPFILYNAADIDSIRYIGTDKYYELGNNIDMVSITDFPIITGTFTGSLDGKGFTISNLKQTHYYDYFTTTHSIRGGIFQNASGTIKNLRLLNQVFDYRGNDPAIANDYYVGFLLSKISAGGANIENVTIENPVLKHESGSSRGKYNYGGISTAFETNATVKKCAVINQDVIINVVSTSTPYIGGLFSNKNTGYIEQCYATGKITCNHACYVGGLIGYLQIDIANDYTKDNYARVDITSTSNSNCGGIAGSISASGTTSDKFIRNYSVYKSSATPGNLIGGFFGYMDYANLSTCYFDSTVFLSGYPGQRNGSYPGVAPNAKSTAQMKTRSTFSGWDFTNIWGMDSRYNFNDGYPYLKAIQPVNNYFIKARLRKPE